MIRRIAAVCLLLATASAVPAQADSNCSNSSANNVTSTMDALGLEGLYARPDSTPESMVVFAHGYRNRSSSWISHLQSASAHGALAVAMDYSGIGPAPDNRGWNVTAGAADSITAAKYFLEHCKSITNVIIFGVSMGGNTSGLAVAEKATRADGTTPLFDYWFNIEGASNMTETYVGATVLAPVNAYAAGAQQDIEAETGGTPATALDAYLERSLVTRGDDIKASGIKGVVLVHGLEDGLVPYNQSREMTAVLRLNEVPTEMITIARRGTGESGTTLSSYVVPNFDPTYQSPFAGHGWEGSTTQLVIKTGHDRLHALLDSLGTGTVDAPQDREIVIDDAATVAVP